MYFDGQEKEEHLCFELDVEKKTQTEMSTVHTKTNYTIHFIKIIWKISNLKKKPMPQLHL